MKYKIGQELYEGFSDEETGKVTLETYKVRTIRGGYVYAILVSKDVTWGKLSKKNGHYGWLPYIPEWCRERAIKGEKFRNLFTTKRHALLDVKKRVLSKYEREWYSEEIKKKILTTIKGQLTRLKK